MNNTLDYLECNAFFHSKNSKYMKSLTDEERLLLQKSVGDVMQLQNIRGTLFLKI